MATTKREAKELAEEEAQAGTLEQEIEEIKEIKGIENIQRLIGLWNANRD